MKKADNGLRFCVDYRKLNSVTVNDAYPLPLMVETLRTVSQYKWVSKVDVISAFHRIRIKQGDGLSYTYRLVRVAGYAFRPDGGAGHLPAVY